MRVLFLCTGNSARSQMAEAILRHLSKGAIDVASAGTKPQSAIHPMAENAVRKLFGISMAEQRPKPVDALVGQRFDVVVTVCDAAAAECPVFPGGEEQFHWSFEDPAAAEGSEDERQRVFDATARAILTRIQLWLSLPGTRTAFTG
jgi:protein-tyrosine-phosphatase